MRLLQNIIIILFFFQINSYSVEMKFLEKLPFKAGEKLLLTINVLGVYIGDQIIRIDAITNINGTNFFTGSGHLYTTPFISSMYKVDDRETSTIYPDNFMPFYYEKWINEGNWHDHLRFFFKPDQHHVIAYQQSRNDERQVLSYSGVLRNYFTLISCMRSVDYAYHIQNKVNLEINYLFGTAIKKAIFKPSYKKVNINSKDIETIYLEEIGGIGMNFYIRNDAYRTPVRLIIPAFEVIGFKTISIYVELKEFIPGNTEILLNKVVIPEVATELTNITNIISTTN